MALGVLLVVGACSRPAPPPRVFRLARIHNDPDGVFLNEKLIFHFSAEIDSSSVHPASVRVLTAEGRPVRGDLEPGRRRVHFVPAPVRAPDYSDGGFLPATEYRVELVGFPSPAALRSVEGAPLASSVTWSFRTVDVEDPETGYIFEDATPERAQLARFVSQRIEPGQPLQLECGEPIDPATVSADDFELREAPAEGAAEGRRIGLKAQLVDNRLPAHDGSGARTLLELTPLERLAPGTYHMIVPHYGPGGGLGLRDFGGNRVWIQSLQPNPIWPITVTQTATSTASMREEFLGTQLRSTQEIGGIDGTAHWGTTGCVELRYPRIAGGGSDGRIELSGRVEAVDVAATELTVPAGGRATLSSGLATVVLRSQGRLVIDGRLEREFPADRRGEPLELASLVPGFPAQGRDALAVSTWLEAARSVERGWTVIVAGGDLVVGDEATLFIDGGLLLVCGGRIRFRGRIHDYRRQIEVYRLGEGGGPVPLQPATGLAIDPPLVNRLRQPLTFGVLSGRIPGRGRVALWREGRAGGYAGASAASEPWNVRYLDARLGDDLRVDSPELHDRPWELGDAPSLRFLVQLRMEPGRGETWDPPRVDFVEIDWDPEGP